MVTRSAQHSLASLRQLYDGSRTLRWLSKGIPILVVLLLWELVSGWLVPAELLPPFSQTAVEIVALGGTPKVQSFAFDTLLRGLAGILIAAVLAVPLGIAMSLNNRLQRNLDPIISITYPVPKSPLIPLVIFWLGIGNASRIALAVSGSILPILLSSYNGADGVSREILWSARSMGVTKREEIYKVVFPAALPTIMAGIRIGLIFSFIIVIASEMILARTGLGVLVIEFGQFGQYAKVFGVIFWITVIVAGLDRLYLLLTDRLLDWSDQDVGAI